MSVPTYTLRKFFLLLLCCISVSLRGQEDLKYLADSLNVLIENEQTFVNRKEERISKIKLKLRSASILEEYKINLALHDEYKKFNVDSAIYYIRKNVDIAVKLAEKEWEIASNLKLSLLYSMGGMYREAESILKNIDLKQLPQHLLSDYYDTYRRFWEYYSISTFRASRYTDEAKKYLNLYLDNGDASTVSYKVCYIVNRIEPKDPEEAERRLIELLNTEEVGSPDYAVITCELATLNGRNHRPDLEQKYFMQSAMADIINATRENFSLQCLAVICYENNDLKRAVKYTQTAIDEALASGIQFRMTQINKFYSVINAAYQEKEAKVKSSMKLFLILITVFFVLSAVLVVYVYRQMKSIKSIKEALAESNEKLKELNKALNDVNGQVHSKNRQLQESNNVKEQFIAQFFDLCSNYIARMEIYQTSLYKLAANRNYETLIKQLKSTNNIAAELDSLYNHFDHIFLNLYPTFVTDFNALLKESEQITLKKGQLLNRELRIYALLRLGINDGGKIASFLRCSTSTIYNYRTKIRNKASLDKDDFENQVLRIG